MPALSNSYWVNNCYHRPIILLPITVRHHGRLLFHEVYALADWFQNEHMPACMCHSFNLAIKFHVFSIELEHADNNPDDEESGPLKIHPTARRTAIEFSYLHHKKNQVGVCGDKSPDQKPFRCFK